VDAGTHRMFSILAGCLIRFLLTANVTLWQKESIYPGENQLGISGPDSIISSEFFNFLSALHLISNVSFVAGAAPGKATIG
jgi:hypothetical protein